MATTVPTRIDDDLYESAKRAGTLLSRSAAQQITHWARIGRELEAAGASTRFIAQTLTDAATYDTLPGDEQAVVRARWQAQMEERRAHIDVDAPITDHGHVALDDDGNLVHWGAGATARDEPAPAAPAPKRRRAATAAAAPAKAKPRTAAAPRRGA